MNRHFLAVARFANVLLTVFVAVVCVRAFLNGVLRTPRVVMPPTYGPTDVWMACGLGALSVLAAIAAFSRPPYDEE